MERELRNLATATGKLMGVLVRSLREFEADTRQARSDLWQEIVRKTGGCGRQQRGSDKQTAEANNR